jgi:hypothetical protein
MIAIDPGLNGTGVAIWTDHPRVPVHTEVLTAPRKLDWIERVAHLSYAVHDLVETYRVRELVCEMMEFHGTAKSAMSWHGDLQRTLILIGSIIGQTHHMIRWTRLTPPSEWKGQLPKSVTILRVEKCLGFKACIELGIQTHAWDAVGIGLWHRGYIK